ncbi:hypothetical protein ACQ86B_17420 [Mycolicibacterium aichiense]|uniref:hypothetical protein n=1 Tax=Mycolicibacterium aichiense TaxID=1799 RepID=UPI003D6687DA
MLANESVWNGSLPFGFEGGISTADDAIGTTADGVALDVVWSEVQDILAAWNANRDALTAVLSYSTTLKAEAIPQSSSTDSFEPASEFGQPESLRPPADYVLMGFDFYDYDKASRWTRFALRDSTAGQIRATLNYALEADNRLLNSAILHQLFTDTARINEDGQTVWPLYNADSTVPPEYLGKRFTSNHQHFLASGHATIDSGDLEDLAKTVTHHGYGVDPTSRLLCLMNPEQAEQVASFKAGEENANSAVAKHSFIPSQGAPAFLTAEQIIGTQAPAAYENLKVEGSYGNLWIVQSDLIPEDYISVVATYGANSPSNAIAVRQHPNAIYQGFRTIPGAGEYPIQDSFFTRAFGTGVRRRGQAACMQITAETSYTAPDIYGYVSPV